MCLNSSVVDKNDLMQAGLYGLMKGLKSFNPQKSKGSQKSTYLIHCIKREIMDEANKFYGPFRLPHAKKLKLNKFARYFTKHDPRDFIKSKLSLSDKEFDEFANLIKFGLKQTQIDNDEVFYVPEFYEQIDDLLKILTLSDYEIKIFKLKLEGHSFKEISKLHGFHVETVRKNYIKLILKLKKNIKERSDEL